MEAIYKEIIKMSFGEDGLSEEELNEAIQEFYEEEKTRKKIQNDEYPLKGLRMAVCSSSEE